MRRHLNQVLTDGLSPQVKGDSTLEGPEAGGSTLLSVTVQDRQGRCKSVQFQHLEQRLAMVCAEPPGECGRFRAN